MATHTRPTRREARQQRREDERLLRLRTARRETRTRNLTIGALAVLVVVGLLLAWGPVSGLLNRGDVAYAQGRQFPNQGQDHVGSGQPPSTYNSNPPTSGPHFPDPLAWGIYDQPQPDEAQVHNLEHGGIVINYNCPDGCPDLVNDLQDLVRQYRSKVVLAPRLNENVPSRITLRAWTWLDGFDDFDAIRIRGFIVAHRDKGPESVPDM